MLGYNHLVSLIGTEVKWIDIRVKWRRDIDSGLLEDLSLGIVDEEKCLHLKVYSGLYDYSCPICDEISYVTIEDDKIGCEKCLGISDE